MTYSFQIMVTSNNTCLIMNGSSIVAQEINRYYTWISAIPEPARTPKAISYSTPIIGYIDVFRSHVEQTITHNKGCTNVCYVVGDRGMDTSGLGNIVFGFHKGNYDISGAHIIGATTQKIHKESWGINGDEPDDYTQIELGLGLGIAFSNGQDINIRIVETYAITYGLQ